MLRGRAACGLTRPARTEPERPPTPPPPTHPTLKCSPSWVNISTSRSSSCWCSASLCSGVHTTNISTLENWCTRYRPLLAAGAGQGVGWRGEEGWREVCTEGHGHRAGRHALLIGSA